MPKDDTDRVYSPRFLVLVKPEVDPRESALFPLHDNVFSAPALLAVHAHFFSAPALFALQDTFFRPLQTPLSLC